MKVFVSKRGQLADEVSHRVPNQPILEDVELSHLFAVGKSPRDHGSIHALQLQVRIGLQGVLEELKVPGHCRLETLES